MVKIIKDEDEGVTYISYLDDEGKLEVWKISTVTKIAQKLPRNNVEPLYDRSIIDKTEQLDIRYITEYLKNLDFYEFEREGDLIFFKEYHEEGEDVFMHTKTCEGECRQELILNIDETKCKLCRNA